MGQGNETNFSEQIRHAWNCSFFLVECKAVFCYNGDKQKLSMALEELNDTLHSRDLHLDRVRKPTLFEPQGVQTDPTATSEFHKTETWEASEKKGAQVAFENRKVTEKKNGPRRRMIAMILGGIAFLLLVFGVAVKLHLVLFSADKILVTLRGADAVMSAESVTFTFEYTNNNLAGISGGKVIFEYPETFLPDAAPGLSIAPDRAEMTVGEIPSRSTGQVKISGKFYASRGDQAILSATLHLDSERSGKILEKQAQKEVSLTSLPLFFEIAAPVELASDQEVQYEIQYGNEGSNAFSGLEIRLEYPRGFAFTGADPSPSSGDATWLIGDLKSNSKAKIVVRGRLVGERDEQKLVHGAIGAIREDGRFVAYREHERRTRIAASPFIILQTVNKGVSPLAIDPGQRLSYEIAYKNEGNVGIRDAILTAEMGSPYIDWGTLQLSSGGAYVESSKTIFWKASDVPALSRIDPGQSGSVSFSVATYSDLKDRFPNVRDFSLWSVAKVDSPDIPTLNGGVTKVVASGTFTVKLNAAVATEFNGYYQDAVIPNSGPLPPVVGQETTYTLHFRAAGSLSNIENSRVSIMLPTGVRYTGKRSPESERMVFNERSNELVWDIGTLEPGKDRELVFQIAAVPNPNSVGQDITLVSKATFTGRDSFTDRELRLEKDKKTSNLPEDPFVQKAGYRVEANGG